MSHDPLACISEQRLGRRKTLLGRQHPRQGEQRSGQCTRLSASLTSCERETSEVPLWVGSIVRDSCMALCIPVHHNGRSIIGHDTSRVTTHLAHRLRWGGELQSQQQTSLHLLERAISDSPIARRLLALRMGPNDLMRAKWVWTYSHLASTYTCSRHLGLITFPWWSLCPQRSLSTGESMVRRWLGSGMLHQGPW